jgi:hypothetical protein
MSNLQMRVINVRPESALDCFHVSAMAVRRDLHAC